jgi:transcriptional regulator with XRE-family HTH domain
MTPTDFRAWRKQLCYTRAAAAEALGISASQILNYELGADRSSGRPAPVPRHVALACAALTAGLEAG